MRITGRGKFTGAIVPTDGGFIIRIDNARDDSFWLEVELTSADLACLGPRGTGDDAQDALTAAEQEGIAPDPAALAIPDVD